MSWSSVERTRTLHQDVERCYHKLAGEMKVKPKSHRERVYQKHVLKNYLDRIQEASKKLLQIYADTDGTRRSSLERLSSISTEKLTETFYEDLRDVTTFHQRFPNQVVEDLVDPDIIKVDQTVITEHGERKKPKEEIEKEKAQLRVQRMFEKPPVQFTGEEAYGRCVDMNAFFVDFVNLPNLSIMDIEDPKSLDYAGFLDLLPALPDRVRVISKLERGYGQFCQRMLDYLEDFQKRKEPLEDITAIIADTINEFEEKWEQGQCRTIPVADVKKLILGTYIPPQHRGNNLYCPLMKKAFTNINVFNARVNGKKYKKLLSRVKDGEDSDYFKTEFRYVKLVALAEARIQKLVDELGDTIEATKQRLVKKQTRTADELEAEFIREEQFAYRDADDDSDDEKDDTNPLNLPLGPDGKPIPYWMYKLHGLGQKFPCEICGDVVYYGPRSFERHFQEWRHAYGMKCLGIPNTREFHHITRIKDAQKLVEKVKQTEKKEWDASHDMEFEDSEGNVLNQKTYNDLKKQGLL